MVSAPRGLFLEDLVQAHRCIPLTSSMVDEVSFWAAAVTNEKPSPGVGGSVSCAAGDACGKGRKTVIRLCQNMRGSKESCNFDGNTSVLTNPENALPVRPIRSENRTTACEDPVRAQLRVPANLSDNFHRGQRFRCKHTAVTG